MIPGCVRISKLHCTFMMKDYCIYMLRDYCTYMLRGFFDSVESFVVKLVFGRLKCSLKVLQGLGALSLHYAHSSRAEKGLTAIFIY